jgi:hypothetical protein
METTLMTPDTFPMVKTLKQIEADPRVESIYKDQDGWWLQLNDGYEWCYNSTLIHEYTIADCCCVLNNDVYKVSNQGA